MHASSSYGGLDAAFSIVGKTLRLMYDFRFNISVGGPGGKDVSLVLLEHYLYVITKLNSTYVKIAAGPVGNSSLKLESGSWPALKSMLKLLGFNVSTFMSRFSASPIKEAVVPASSLPQALRAVDDVSPVLLKVVPADCVNIAVYGVVFNARKYSVGAGGVAYYECRTGVLLKYVSPSSAVIRRDGVVVRAAFEALLSAASPTLLRAIAVGPAGHVARAEATRGAPGGLGGGVLTAAYLLLAVSAAAAALAGYTYFKIRRSVRR